MFKVLKNTLKIKKPRKAFRKIRLGICAMDKKAQSKPMREILSRLPSEIFEIITFGDDRILNEPIEEWPVVEALIAFYSTRFPTEKVMAYVKLRKPFLLNDLEVDNNLLKDRRKVYKMLQSQGIEVPKHVILNRDGSDAKNSVEEFDEVNAHTKLLYIFVYLKHHGQKMITFLFVSTISFVSFSFINFYCFILNCRCST